jgi:cell division protein FtsI/penicillin-binding protein 2
MFGTITMQTALNYSLNTGSTQALRLIGGDPNSINRNGMDILYKYYHDVFGFGQLTGVELLETEGQISTPDSGYAMDLTYANMTFGQGVSISMVQLASAFSSIVNGGKYYTPSVLAGKIEKDVFVKDENAKFVRNTVSETTSEVMRGMLYGTRYNRRLYGIDRPGYYVGGKTGTGQVIIQRSDGTWGYSEAATGETIANYVGFGGAEGELPEYVIVVKIWGEGHHFEGERDALPMFDTISNYMIDYLKIKPKE